VITAIYSILQRISELLSVIRFHRQEITRTLNIR